MSDSFTIQKRRIEQVDPNDQAEVERIRFENQMLLETGWLTLSQFETLTALLKRRIDPPESTPEN